MNWKLAAVSLVVCCLTVSTLAQTPLPNPIPIVISGPGPWIDVKAYGAVGNGSANDHDAIQNAIDACPLNGCTIFFPAGGGYKIGTALKISSAHNGVKLLGECGVQSTQNPGFETCSHIVADTTFPMSDPILTVGDGGTGFHSGLVIQDLGFQDVSMTKDQINGAIRLFMVQDFSLTNVHCQNIRAGYCFLFDGNGHTSNNFTQFGVVVNPSVVDVKFPVQIKPQASEVNFYGGNLNCASNTNVPLTTIGMDLGKTYSDSGQSSGGEFGIFGTHIMNCDTAISMYNMSNLNYYGIVEQTMNGPIGDGIVLDGNASGKELKSIIAGSIDGFDRGLVLQGMTQDTRVLANISNTHSSLITVSGSLPSTLILTPLNYPAGTSGGTAIGSQLPDLTIPGEAAPAVPATGSRRLYVDSGTGNNSDLSVKRSDGTIIDLEGGLLSYQGTGATVTGGLIAKTVYTFTIPSIKAGAGIRAKAFWQTTTSSGNNKNFVWKFGSTAFFYTGDPTSNSSLSSAEVTIFNNPGSQGNQTMFSSPIINQTSLVVAGGIASPAETTTGPVTLLFQLNPGSGTETITPKGFIVEAVQ